jgi:hypothetical protein
METLYHARKALEKFSDRITEARTLKGDDSEGYEIKWLAFWDIAKDYYRSIGFDPDMSSLEPFTTPGYISSTAVYSLARYLYEFN